MATTIRGIEHRLFEAVLGADPTAIEEAVIADDTVGESSLDRVAERLVELFAATKGDVLRVLGVSRTKVSRNPVMDVEILDRAGNALKLYARVAAMVGSERAAAWLNKPNRQLSDRRPIDLLATHLGGARVEELVTSLEDGAYL